MIDLRSDLNSEIHSCLTAENVTPCPLAGATEVITTPYFPVRMTSYSLFEKHEPNSVLWRANTMGKRFPLKVHVIKESSQLRNLRSCQMEAVEAITNYFKTGTILKDYDTALKLEGEEEDEGGTKVGRGGKKRKSDDVSNGLTEDPFHPCCMFQPEPMLKRNCKVSMPPGSGKSAVIVSLILTQPGMTLVITDSFENGKQILKTLVENTNAHYYMDVRLFVSDEKIRTLDSTLSKFALNGSNGVNAEDVMRKHILNGAGGVLIVDNIFFRGSVTEVDRRKNVRNRIAQSFWQLVIVDEADAVFTDNTRSIFDEGVHVADQGMRLKMRFKNSVSLSGTWLNVRNDKDLEWIDKNTGPMIYKTLSVDNEKMGYVSKMAVATILCKDSSDEHKTRLQSNDNLHIEPIMGLSLDKLKALEAIVKLHTFNGHKIMIFTNRKKQAQAVEGLFPGSRFVTGSTPSVSKAEAAQLFKTNKGGLWITTEILSRGADIPDVSVVINLANKGESPRDLYQRMGRAMRRAIFSRGWFYDILTPKHSKLADNCTFEDVKNARRYGVLKQEGYGERHLVIKSDDLPNLVAWQLCKETLKVPDDHKACKLFVDYSNLPFATDNPIVNVSLLLLLTEQEKSEPKPVKQTKGKNPETEHRIALLKAFRKEQNSRKGRASTSKTSDTTATRRPVTTLSTSVTEFQDAERIEQLAVYEGLEVGQDILSRSAESIHSEAKKIMVEAHRKRTEDQDMEGLLSTYDTAEERIDAEKTVQECCTFLYEIERVDNQFVTQKELDISLLSVKQETAKMTARVRGV